MEIKIPKEDSMPQLNKGGKYVFGWLLIRPGGILQFPSMAVSEYKLNEANAVIAFTGSKSTGGFCVTTEKLLAGSKLKGILEAIPVEKCFGKGNLRRNERVKDYPIGYIVLFAIAKPAPKSMPIRYSLTSHYIVPSVKRNTGSA